MAKKIYSGNMRAGVGVQAAWATPLTVASNFRLMNYDRLSVVPDLAVTVEPFDVIGMGGIIAQSDKTFFDRKSGLPRLSFSASAARGNIAPHIVGSLQEVTEGATTPFQKAAVIAGRATVLDFAADEGHLHSVFFENFGQGTGTNDAWILENAIIDNWTLQIQPNNQGIARLAKISGEWVGRQLTKALDTFSGTLTAQPGTNYFPTSAAKFTLQTSGFTAVADATDLCFTNFELIVNNNVGRDCVGADAVAAEFTLSPEALIRMTIPKLSTTYKWLDELKTAGGAGAISLSTGSTGVSGYLNITAAGTLLSVTPVDVNGYEYFDLEFRCETTGTTTPLDSVPLQMQSTGDIDENKTQTLIKQMD
jgi:hypothetical protein